MDRINVIDAKKYKQMLINGAPEGGEPIQKSSGSGFRATSETHVRKIIVKTIKDSSPIPDKVFNHPGPQLQKTISGQGQVKARRKDNRIFRLISSWEVKVKKSVKAWLKGHLQGQKIPQEIMTFGESERELLAR